MIVGSTASQPMHRTTRQRRWRVPSPLRGFPAADPEREALGGDSESLLEEMLRLGKQILAAQPFSVPLGSELISWSDAGAELEIPVEAELKQQNGFVHEGVISYAADNALAYAGGSALGPGVVTSEFKINYVRPAMGEFILARATPIHAGKDQAVCRCAVYLCGAGRENLCATAQGTIARVGQSSEART